MSPANAPMARPLVCFELPVDEVDAAGDAAISLDCAGACGATADAAGAASAVCVPFDSTGEATPVALDAGDTVPVNPAGDEVSPPENEVDWPDVVSLLGTPLVSLENSSEDDDE